VIAIRSTWLNELMLMRMRKKTMMFAVISAIVPIVSAYAFRTVQTSIGMIGLSVSFPILLLSLYSIFWIFVLYAAAKTLPFFSPAFAAFSVTAYSDWYVLWLGNATSRTTLLQTSAFLVSGTVLFFSLGYFMFDRKEV